MKDNLKVYTFSGVAGSGKTTAANKLKEIITKYDPDKKVYVLAYADYLKYIAKTFYDWDGVKDEYGRELLQTLGTDEIRATDENFWVNSVISQIEMFARDADVIIMSDARFPNEIQCWYDRLGVENVFDILLLGTHDETRVNDEQAQHSSETALNDWSFAMTLGCPTLEDLEGKLKLVYAITK